LGGRLGYKDQGETPNMLLSVYEFGDTLLVFETRGLVDKPKEYPRKVANEYYTTEGRIADGKFYPRNGGAPEKVSGGTPDPVKPGGPFGSFIQAMRSRKREDLNADVEVAHYSAALCHLGNISYRLGHAQAFGPEKPAILGDNSQVQESFAKIQGNLEALGVDLKTTDYQLGPVLAFDPAAEKFKTNADANKLLTRDYRKPYVVPEKV